MNEVSLNIKKFIAETMPECITAALNDACQVVENKAVDKCPVDDGTLRASITHSVEQDGNVFTGTVGSNVEYAPYVHEGTGIYAREGKGRQNVPWVYKTADGKFYTTKGQKPNPFLQEALDSSYDDILNAFAGCLEE